MKASALLSLLALPGWAQYNLGLLYHHGLGVKRQLGKAAKWYGRAAENGHVDAQKAIGDLYVKGFWGKKDYAKAATWYRKAAEQGHAAAQTNLGWMYREGRGVPQDDAEAVRWYRMAAEQGEALGQRNLGVLYRDGKGIFQADTDSTGLFGKFVERGWARVKFNLATVYSDVFGKNLFGKYPEDIRFPIMAYMWFSLAEERGDKNARDYRVQIAKKMSPEQIAEAQRLAREWKPKKDSSTQATAAQ